MTEPPRRGPAVPVGGGIPIDPDTGQRFGYLPSKAARRKIVIRAQLGRPWILGALLAAVVIAAVGGYFLARPTRPGAPYVDQGTLTRYPAGAVTPLLDGSGWLDRRAGLQALTGASAYCPADGGWVGAGGVRFDPAGRSSTGGAGLAVLPVRAAGGRVYVDVSRPRLMTGRGGRLAPCAAPQRLGRGG